MVRPLTLRARLMLLVAVALVPAAVLVGWLSANATSASASGGGTNLVFFRVLGSLAVIAVVAFGLAWLVSERFIVRHVRALVDASRRLEAGELAARTGLGEGEGEFSELGHAFDRMASALEAHEAAMRKADAMKTRVVEIAAHELSAPATRSHANDERTRAIADDLRDVAHIASGAFEPARERFDATAAARETASAYFAALPRPRPSIVIRAKQALPIVADRDAFARVLRHVLAYACRSTTRSGTVRLEAAIEGDDARVRVVATGDGLTPGEVARLFGPVDPELGERSALDLFVAKSLVERMHGRLDAVSAGPRAGVTFTMSFPLAEPAHALPDRDANALNRSRA
ncbi:MAG: HAMP domain-containing sensor histidine kinase [Thermoplasmatota archaeon]